MRGLNKQKKFKEKLPNNPHDLNERFSCNLDKAKCMPEKCISCKSSDWIEEIVLVESTEAKDSEDSSNYTNSEGSEDIGSENDAAEVTVANNRRKNYQSYDSNQFQSCNWNV